MFEIYIKINLFLIYGVFILNIYGVFIYFNKSFKFFGKLLSFFFMRCDFAYNYEDYKNY